MRGGDGNKMFFQFDTCLFFSQVLVFFAWEARIGNIFARQDLG